MPQTVSIGDEAPNFDLASTENAILTLWDEVARRVVVLYFFADPDADRVRRDLQALDRYRPALDRYRASVLGISPAKLADLQRVQKELKLLFPLLHDDRNFSAAYGIEPGTPEQPPAPALVMVSRKQRILWLANPVAAVEDAMPQVEKLLKGQPRPTVNYPKSVINRFIDRFVN